jgi:hypothetical protein
MSDASFNIAIATSTQQQTSNAKADRQQQQQQHHPSNLFLLSIPHLPSLSAHTGALWNFEIQVQGRRAFWMGSFLRLFLFISFCAANRFRLGLSNSQWVRNEKQAGLNNERTASVA